MAPSDCAVSDILRVVAEEQVVMALQDIEKARTESSERKRVQLSEYDDDDLIRRTFTTRKSFDSKYTLLLWQDTEQEAVLDVQGIVVRLMLPPLSRERFGSIHRPLHMRQNAAVLASTECFRKACSALGRLYRFVEQQFGANQMRPWTLPTTGSLQTIGAETRYVSQPIELRLWPDAVPQLRNQSALDKNGVIQSWVDGGEVVFTEDNLVQYAEVICGPGVSRRVVTDPSTFRVGQIAELGLSIRAIKTRNAPLQFSFVTHMDSLLLMNRLPATLLADIKALRESVVVLGSPGGAESHSPMPKKRRVLEEDMFEFDKSSAAQRMSHLEVSGPSNKSQDQERMQGLDPSREGE